MDFQLPQRVLPKRRDGLYYLVLADLVGSTEFARQMGNDTSKAQLERFEFAAKQALTHCTPKNSGEFIKPVGDAVLLVFQHFPDIVEWHIQFDGNLLLTSLAMNGTRGMCTRILVDAGEIVFCGSDISGLALNELFKIEKAGKSKLPAGALVLTDTARSLAEPSLFPRQCVLEHISTLIIKPKKRVTLSRIVIKADIPFLMSKQHKDALAN
jgi:class 3 adenylate cyclase